MVSLYVRPPPELRKRLGFAAVHHDMATTSYSKKLIDQWRTLGERDLAPIEDESGSHRMIEIPVGNEAAVAVRMSAARQGISQSAMVNRIIGHYVPFVVETMMAEIEAGGG